MPKSAQLRLAVLSSMARGPMLDPFSGPNVERMTADPNVCFIEGTEGTEGTPPAAPEPKYTDADMQKAVQTRLSKETKKYEAQISELQAKAAEAEELKARMATLEEERELAGKSATERAQAQAQKELDKLRREIDEREERMRKRYIASKRHTIQVDFKPYMDGLGKELVAGRERALSGAVS